VRATEVRVNEMQRDGVRVVLDLLRDALINRVNRRVCFTRVSCTLLASRETQSRMNAVALALRCARQYGKSPEYCCPHRGP
jgi:hypothetical protein